MQIGIKLRTTELQSGADKTSVCAIVMLIFLLSGFVGKAVCVCKGWSPVHMQIFEHATLYVFLCRFCRVLDVSGGREGGNEIRTLFVRLFRLVRLPGFWRVKRS